MPATLLTAADHAGHIEGPSKAQEGMAAPAKDDAVLLVHGTFAAADADAGIAWWQHGSPFSQALTSRLALWSCCVRELPPFHWSGDNRDRARWTAASELLARLRELEQREVPYHVIAHSHGGSVLWNALTLSFSGRSAGDRTGELRYLRSLATIGTPFLRHFPEGAQPTRLLSDLLILVLGIALIGLAFLLHPQESWHQAALLPIVVLGGALTALGGLIRAANTFLTLLEMAIERGAEAKATLAYGERWLSLWSPDDEAINGLRATTNVAWIRIPAREINIPAVFRADRSVATLRRVMAPVTRAWVTTYNALVLPLVESIVRNNISRTFQGNDRPATKITEVSRDPTVGLLPSPAMPDGTCTALRANADRAAARLVPALRPLLAHFALSGDPAVALSYAGLTLSGNELVHTSYFDHVDVQDLLACHIAIHCSNRPATVAPGFSTHLHDWLAVWQNYLVTALAEFAKRPKFMLAEFAEVLLRSK